MRQPRRFDYDRPSREALTGINVEVTDSSAAPPVMEMPGSRGGLVAPGQAEQLFGLMVTVDEEFKAEQPSGTPLER